jgi:hypothetical protein
MPKRCGHFSGKAIIEAPEMINKIKAAVDARHDDNFLIMARTDSRAVLASTRPWTAATPIAKPAPTSSSSKPGKRRRVEAAAASHRGAADRQSGRRRKDADLAYRRIRRDGFRTHPLRQCRAARRHSRHDGSSAASRKDAT